MDTRKFFIFFIPLCALFNLKIVLAYLSPSSSFPRPSIPYRLLLSSKSSKYRWANFKIETYDMKRARKIVNARTQNEVEDELADLLGNDENDDNENEMKNSETKAKKSNFLSADKSKPSKLPAASRGSVITGDDYIDESNEDNYKGSSIEEENDNIDILSMFRNLKKGDEKGSEYQKPKSIRGSSGKGKKGPQYDLISEQRLKDEIVSPYKNNWILLILITIFSLVFFGYLFPEELFQVPSIPVPDL